MENLKGRARRGSEMQLSVKGKKSGILKAKDVWAVNYKL